MQLILFIFYTYINHMIYHETFRRLGSEVPKPRYDVILRLRQTVGLLEHA
jgi:hypothetical protein